MEPPRGRGLGARVSWLGLAISLLAVAGVVCWALRQDPPELPQTAGELAAVAAAIALYALATVVRSERWQRLLEDEGARPARPDTYALTCVGYMGNNLLPARAGRRDPRRPDGAARGDLQAARWSARCWRSGCSTSPCWSCSSWSSAGGCSARSARSRSWIVALVAAGAALAVGAAYLLVRRNERIVGFVAPMASATLGLRRGPHGLLLLGLTLVIWAIETGVWMSVGAAVGFGMTPIEGVYIVALASVFSMIPSGPAYAGTQDAAAIIGVKALGGTGAQAVAYLVMLRFVIVVPITAVGLVLLVTRYGGLGRLRSARLEARG